MVKNEKPDLCEDSSGSSSSEQAENQRSLVSLQSSSSKDQKPAGVNFQHNQSIRLNENYSAQFMSQPWPCNMQVNNYPKLPGKYIK